MTTFEKIVWALAFVSSVKKTNDYYNTGENINCALEATMLLEALKATARQVEYQLSSKDIIENTLLNKTSVLLAEMLIEKGE